MHRTFAESEKLYEEIKNFFYKKDEREFVIEISDKPMNEWNVKYVNSDMEMYHERVRLDKKGSSFAGFAYADGYYNLYFADYNFFKCQNTKSGEILVFFDETFSEINLDKVVSELKQLQGS
jgi:hypothetical protein